MWHLLQVNWRTSGTWSWDLSDSQPTTSRWTRTPTLAPTPSTSSRTPTTPAGDDAVFRRKHKLIHWLCCHLWLMIVMRNQHLSLSPFCKNQLIIFQNKFQWNLNASWLSNPVFSKLEGCWFESQVQQRIPVLNKPYCRRVCQQDKTVHLWSEVWCLLPPAGYQYKHLHWTTQTKCLFQNKWVETEFSMMFENFRCFLINILIWKWVDTLSCNQNWPSNQTLFTFHWI